MKLCMQIFADWLKDFHPKADIKSNLFEIEAVRLFSANVTMEKNTLYIGRLRDLFTNGNDRIICAHGNDLLQLDTTDLEEVLNYILNALAFYTAWDNTMMKLLTSGAMLQDLFDASETILSRPAFLLDPSQRHLAHTANYGVGEVDDMWDHILTCGTCDMDFLLAFNQADPDRLTRRGIYSYEEPYFPNESYHYNFIFHGNFLGSATLIIPDGTVTEGELNCFSLFCHYIELWFQIHIQEQGSIILDTQLRSAISNPHCDTSELRRRFLLLGWSENDPLVFFKLDAPFQPFSINTHLSHSLNISCSNLYAITAELSVCLLCNLRKLPMDQTKAQILPWLVNSKYYCSIGQIFKLTDSFYDNYKYVEVTSAKCEQKVGQIYDCKNYVLPYLFDQMGSTIVPDILHPALKQLQDYDTQHHTDFYETLYVYLKNERSIADTARSLNLHRNTLLYRLKRLDELVTDDLNDYLVRLHLMLSYEIENTKKE